MSERDDTTKPAAGDPKDGTDTTDRDADLASVEGLGDKGKAAIKANRDERDAAKARADAAEARVRDLEAAEQKRADEKRKADETAAEQRGEFEKLAAKREEERDAAKADAASLKARNDQLETAVAAIVEAGWKKLPAEVRDAFSGKDDDHLAKLEWLPRGQALAEKLEAKAPPARGNGQDPKPGGSGVPSVDDEKKALLSRGGYSM